MVDSMLKFVEKKGYREDRMILFGYECGCGPALHYCDILSKRKKEKLSVETSGILLFYPTDNIPMGIDLHFDSFYNSTQNVVYYHVLMLIPKGDKSFRSMETLKHIAAEDPKWKERVDICVHKFARLNPTSLDRPKIIKIVEATTPWFKKINAQIMKYR